MSTMLEKREMVAMLTVVFDWCIVCHGPFTLPLVSLVGYDCCYSWSLSAKPSNVSYKRQMNHYICISLIFLE